MVKSAERRSVHYDKKLDGDVWNFRITQEKDFMVEQIHDRYAVQAFLEEKVGRYLEGVGFYGIEKHHYMNFSQELWSLTRSFSGLAIARIHGIDLTAWVPD